VNEGLALPGQAPAAAGLTREILAPAVVVVIGAIMTILDATIVNVALPTLGQDLHTSISTIQWVPTVYLLAALAEAFGVSFAVALAITVLALVPAALLPPHASPQGGLT
jgi:hypothetical protein